MKRKIFKFYNYYEYTNFEMYIIPNIKLTTCLSRLSIDWLWFKLHICFKDLNKKLKLND